MKVVSCLFALVAVAAARSAYQFSDGYLDILGGEPNQAFECSGRPYGYYADVANDCRVFHVCLPISNEVGEVQFSFFCGNQTVFSQESLTCADAEEAFPCGEAESLFDLSNFDFGRIPDNVDIVVRIPENPVVEQNVDIAVDQEIVEYVDQEIAEVV